MRIILAITVLALISCNKPQKKDWQCETVIYQNKAEQGRYKNIIKDKTEDDIRVYEKKNSSIIANGSMITTCK